MGSHTDTDVNIHTPDTYSYQSKPAWAAGYDFRFIAACSRNHVIGKGGKIPWHIPEDLQHFQNKTMGHTVLMGRATYESIIRRLGHPLKFRRTIVLSTTIKDKPAHNVDVIASIDELPDVVDKHARIFIAGGETIYKQFGHWADQGSLTIVNTVVHNGDAFFPKDLMDKLSVLHQDVQDDYIIYETEVA